MRSKEHFHHVIDVGNTRAKISRFVDRKLINQESFDRDDEASILDYLKSEPLSKGIFSSSASLGEDLRSYLLEHGFLELSSGLNLPLRLYYDTPTTLGSDRLAQVIGTWAEFGDRNSLTVSLGTCVTYNFVSAQGSYLGGNISPGLQMRMRSMHDMTDKLPLLNVSYKADMIGTSTETAMVGGVFLGLIYEIQGYIDKARASFDDLLVVMTGGDAHSFEGLFDEGIIFRPDVALFGLNEIYFLNAN